jgi:hypothetical protein
MHKLALAAVAPALALGLAASAPRAAGAECLPARFLGTPSGATLPRVGSIYVYDQRAGWADAETAYTAVFRGAPGVSKVTIIGEGVERIDYVYGGFGDGSLEVSLGDAWAHAVYHIDPAWRPEPAPRVLQYWRDAPNMWDEGDAVMIQIDQPVAAVVARWTFDGVVTEWLVAPHTDEDLPGASVVELGEVTCGAQTLDMAEMHAGGHLELVGIRADGSRVAIHGLPDRIAEDQMPADSVGFHHAVTSTSQLVRHDLAPPQPPPAPPAVGALPADWNPMRGLDDALWLGAGAGGALALVFFGLFRLRPSLRAPE